MTQAEARRISHLLTLSPERIAREARRMQDIDAGDRFWQRRVVRTVLKAAAWYFGGLSLIASSLMVHGFDLGRVLYRVRGALARLDLPVGATLETAGQDEEMERSFGSLKLAMPTVQKGPPPVFPLGRLSDFRMNTLTWLQDHGLFVIRNQVGVGAFSREPRALVTFP